MISKNVKKQKGEKRPNSEKAGHFCPAFLCSNSVQKLNTCEEKMNVLKMC